MHMITAALLAVLMTPGSAQRPAGGADTSAAHAHAVPDFGPQQRGGGGTWPTADREASGATVGDMQPVYDWRTQNCAQRHPPDRERCAFSFKCKNMTAQNVGLCRDCDPDVVDAPTKAFRRLRGGGAGGDRETETVLTGSVNWGSRYDLGSRFCTKNTISEGTQSGQPTVSSGRYIITVLRYGYRWLILQLCGCSGPTVTFGNHLGSSYKTSNLGYDVGPSLDRVRHECAVYYNASWRQEPRLYASREWIQSPWIFANQTVVALTHMEHHCDAAGSERSPSCAQLNLTVGGGDFSAVTLLASTNGGRSWTHARTPPAHVVAASPQNFSVGGNRMGSHLG